MIKVYKTVDGQLTMGHDMAQEGVWINLVEPTLEEMANVSQATGIPQDMMLAALDLEERSRIEADEGQLLILINVPVVEGTDGRVFYDTIPLGIIVTPTVVATVCLRDNPVIADLEVARPRTVYTGKRTRFVLQVLLKTATFYLKFLTQIDRKSDEVEAQLHTSMKNEQLIKLFNLNKSLVYFRTSLTANQMVMEKLLKSQLSKADPDSEVTAQLLKMYAEDEDLLEDVIIENKQALEMSQTYSDILSGMMDAFASVISNNLNIVMKFLTAVTIVLTLPTMVASFYGMNVALPFQHSPYAFLGTIIVSAVLAAAAAVFLTRNRML